MINRSTFECGDGLQILSFGFFFFFLLVVEKVLYMWKCICNSSESAHAMHVKVVMTWHRFFWVLTLSCH